VTRANAATQQLVSFCDAIIITEMVNGLLLTKHAAILTLQNNSPLAPEAQLAGGNGAENQGLIDLRKEYCVINLVKGQ
jgi:hypothetical protein